MSFLSFSRPIKRWHLIWTTSPFKSFPIHHSSHRMMLCSPSAVIVVKQPNFSTSSSAKCWIRIIKLTPKSLWRKELRLYTENQTRMLIVRSSLYTDWTKGNEVKISLMLSLQISHTPGQHVAQRQQYCSPQRSLNYWRISHFRWAVPLSEARPRLSDSSVLRTVAYGYGKQTHCA